MSQAADEADPAAAARVLDTNFTGPASLMLAFAAILRQQGHGRMVVLSSVAGVRVRRANFIYGSAKAGLDAFATRPGRVPRRERAPRSWSSAPAGWPPR